MLHIPRAMSSHSEQSVDISGPRDYNAIPQKVMSIVPYKFRIQLQKQHLIKIDSFGK